MEIDEVGAAHANSATPMDVSHEGESPQAPPATMATRTKGEKKSKKKKNEVRNPKETSRNENKGSERPATGVVRNESTPPTKEAGLPANAATWATVVSRATKRQQAKEIKEVPAPSMKPKTFLSTAEKAAAAVRNYDHTKVTGAAKTFLNLLTEKTEGGNKGAPSPNREATKFKYFIY